MRGLYHNYFSLLNKEKTDPPPLFWDLVILSAGDAEQKQWFESQLEAKRGAGRLPMADDTEYLVFADPGAKGRAGDGAATLNIINELVSVNSIARISSPYLNFIRRSLDTAMPCTQSELCSFTPADSPSVFQLSASPVRSSARSR